MSKPARSRPCHRFIIATLWIVLWLVGVGQSPTAQAHHLVPRYALACAAPFPCPPELQRRVDFWIQVFRKWSIHEAAFHDLTHPARVYSVIRTESCSTRKSRATAREYKRVRRGLRRLADKLAAGKRTFSSEELHYLKLYRHATAAKLRASAGRLRCQQGNRERFTEALRRYGRYGDMVSVILEKQGLPPDIRFLPFVESSYNPAAYSRVGAAGMWQIMPATARNLGLDINATLDERLDPEAATRAAASYFKDSVASLTGLAESRSRRVAASDIGPFVITSYNYGVGGMRRAMRRYGPDFVKVLNRYKSPSFRVAVKNFYASFLAARHVAENAPRYFGKIEPLPPLRYKTVVLKKPIKLGRVKRIYGVGTDRLKSLNPALTRYVWHEWRPVPAGYRLRLPSSTGGWARRTAELDALPADVGTASAYRVKRGDTACGVARAFQVSCRDLIALNDLNRRGFIRVGQRLRIPGAVATTTSTAAGPAPARYVVRAGDTACQVASRYGVSCRRLITENRLGSKATIRIGQQLLIPGVAAPVAAPPTEYVVHAGDTACQIASRQHVSCRRLIAENGLGSKATIRVGQRLRIPGVAMPVVAPPASYTVRAGDTACAIAERFAVPCRDVIVANDLGRRATIRIGQTLRIPGAPAVATTAPAPLQDYTVQRGDTACTIAARFEVDCKTLIALNGLGRRALIRVGQALKIPAGGAPLAHDAGSAVAQTASADTQVDSGSAGKTAAVSQDNDDYAAVLDGVLDLGIKTAHRGGRNIYTIEVEPEETLGYYADWLGLGGTRALRRLNKLDRAGTLRVGQRLRLPAAAKARAKTFEASRDEFHRVLVEEFKERYAVVGVDQYTVRRGDTPWSLADRLDVPLWVLTRYNPQLRSDTPAIGDTLTVPELQARNADGEAGGDSSSG